ncbi:hypothetical protein L3X38_006591 [Prunus dulcis]|uniref:Uncharacterized protein n=1 Tax=Prunus dulcis TaxID=3755 RepID=A0AAD4ZT76_PRUDU|nr:hypothetical protein L3X38_006591 [Prunus dulcis]
MAQMGRLLARQWPVLQQHCCTFHHLLYSPLLPVTTKTGSHRFSLTKVHLATRGVHKLLRGLRPSDYQDANIGSSGSGSDSDSVTYKSRNELKRHARRAVRWAMDLSSFSTPQIKRILRVASLDQDVLDALILVKKFGPDVREGKRRQFNYIGKMLREVEPDLMDALIQATKDSDESKLQALSGPETLSIDDNEEQEEAEETDYEEEEEGSHIDVATRWFDGLINKDVQITNEVYSISNVEFDRQELRKLVRRVHSGLEDEVNSEENGGAKDAARVSAEKSLTRFLRSLAKSSLVIVM